MKHLTSKHEQVRLSRLNTEINRRSVELEERYPDSMSQWHYIKVAREVVGERPDLVDHSNPLDRVISLMAR